MIALNYDNATIKSFRVKDENDLINVVKFVEWSYSWELEEYPGVSTTSAFITKLNSPDPDNFINVDSINKQTLLDWATAVESSNIQNIYHFVKNEVLPHSYDISLTQERTLGE